MVVAIFLATGAVYSGGCSVVYFSLAIREFSDACDQCQLVNPWVRAACGSAFFAGFVICVVGSSLCGGELLRWME